jgi:hypothetical protein
MRKIGSLLLAVGGLLLALPAFPAAAAAEPAPAATIDFAALPPTGDCGSAAASLALPFDPQAQRISKACVYSKTCGGWFASGCCSGGSALQEQKRNCEEKCCQGTLCLSSGTVTETRCVSGPC